MSIEYIGITDQHDEILLMKEDELLMLPHEHLHTKNYFLNSYDNMFNRL
ncbi:MAG: hypothetical protein Q8K60_08610 [Parachlamydiaceae bacterium]|nr:hypothetical protein [Parachlamydiaceae bacterium]